MKIKSITPVRISGAVFNGAWSARMRLADGSELFDWCDVGYNLAQAQALIANCPHRAGEEFDADFRMNDPLTGKPFPSTFRPLPDGAKVMPA